MPRKIKGLRRHGAGWQTYCRVAGDFRSETWALDTPISEMTGWLKKERGEQSDPRSSRDSFAKSATTYLDKVRALPTFKQRKRHIGLWTEVFAGQRRKKITSAQIRGQRDRWLLEGLAPHTVNLRLRALSNLWTVLDGRRAPNPVRDVPEAREADAEPRDVPYWLACRVADAVPTRNPLERAQALLMASTGLTPVEMAHSAARHWKPTERTLFVQGRSKGQGGASRTIPLDAPAIAAVEYFDEVHGWGRLPSKQFYRVFRKACLGVADDPLTIDAQLRQQVRELEPYDLRHSYATKRYRESGDVHAVAYLLGHRDKKTTARYVQSTLAERVAKAVRQEPSSEQERAC